MHRQQVQRAHSRQQRALLQDQLRLAACLAVGEAWSEGREVADQRLPQHTAAVVALGTHGSLTQRAAHARLPVLLPHSSCQAVQVL